MIGVRVPFARSRRATSSPSRSGQPDVQDDRIQRVACFSQDQAIAARHGELDDVSILAEEPSQEAPEAGVVLDDEKVHNVLLPALSEGSMRKTADWLTFDGSAFVRHDSWRP